MLLNIRGWRNFIVFKMDERRNCTSASEMAYQQALPKAFPLACQGQTRFGTEVT